MKNEINSFKKAYSHRPVTRPFFKEQAPHCSTNYISNHLQLTALGSWFIFYVLSSVAGGWRPSRPVGAVMLSWYDNLTRICADPYLCLIRAQMIMLFFSILTTFVPHVII